MTEAIEVALIGLGGTGIIAAVGFMNFVTARQSLRATREQLAAVQKQLENAQRQLETAQQQPNIQLIQQSVSDIMDYLHVLIQHYDLRDYFYSGREIGAENAATRNQVLLIAELMLNRFASAIIHSIEFAQYPIGGIEFSIKFHLRNSPALRQILFEQFNAFPITGLTFLCWMNDSKLQIENDLRELIKLAQERGDPSEVERRRQLLEVFKADETGDALRLAKDGLMRARRSMSEQDDGQSVVYASSALKTSGGL
jgi:hypothetical protein